MPRPKEVHQLLACLSFGDAISDEALRIQSLLRDRGFDSDIFAETYHGTMAGRARPLWAYRDVSNPENLLIFHFSIGSGAARLAYQVPDRLLLRYHNVTPGHWFAPYDKRLSRRAHLGRRELAAFPPRTRVAIGVSEYNRQELERTGFERTGVVPLLWDRARLDLPPDEVVLKLFDDDRTNFLFVGRIMPNKCIEDVIQVFHLYQKHWDRRSRLLLVGDPGILDRYFLSLQRHVERLGVRNVVFAGHVTTAELAAYYELADVFLCLSEHEGFCLPLLEAFGFGVPVMAFEAGGVPEALGGAGILIREKRFDDIAAMAHLLVHDEGFRSRVVERELGVLEEIERRDDAGKLLSFAQEALESGVTSEPRGPSA